MEQAVLLCDVGMPQDMKEHFRRDIIKWLFVIPTVRMFCWRRKTDMTGACGRARQVSSLKSSPVLIAQPGNLYSTGCEQIDIGGEEIAVRELSPASLVRRLELNIKITSGETGEVAQCEKLTGRLTGLSPGVYLSSGKPFSGTSAFMVFEPELASFGVYSTIQNLFNLPEKGAGSSPVSLLLDMELADGKEVSTSIDITEEIGKAFIENTFSVILDLTVKYDEINGLTVLLAEWKKEMRVRALSIPEKNNN